MNHPIPTKPPRKRRPVTLDRQTDQLLALLADIIDTSAAQLANFLITYGLLTYLDDNALAQTLRESRSPARAMKFHWDLLLPADWLEAMAAYLPENDEEDRV